MKTQQQLLGWLGCFWGVMLVVPKPAAAQAFRQVSTTQTQGLASQPIPTIEVSSLWGLTISFIPSGEFIQQVRVGDPSRVVVDFDAPLGDGETQSQGDQVSGATVIYLRQLGQPLNLDQRLTSQARNSEAMPLTVITLDRQRNRRLHQFRLQLGGSPEYSTVEVMPDVMIAQRQLAAQRSARPTLPSLLPSRRNPTPQSSNQSSDQVATQLERGLQQARSQSIVGLTEQMQLLVQELIERLRTGESIEDATSALSVPPGLVEQILSIS